VSNTTEVHKVYKEKMTKTKRKNTRLLKKTRSSKQTKELNHHEFKPKLKYFLRDFNHHHKKNSPYQKAPQRLLPFARITCCFFLSWRVINN
jgi:hypothetical protein